MASFNIYRSYTSNINISTCVKYVRYITVGGGGGGAYPNIPVFRPNFTSPQAGGYSCAGGTISYGGNPGSWYSGGSGGYGNWRYGSTGRFGGGPWNRAASGYGSTGQGGAGGQASGNGERSPRLYPASTGNQWMQRVVAQNNIWLLKL